MVRDRPAPALPDLGPNILWTIPVALAVAIAAVVLSIHPTATDLAVPSATVQASAWYLACVVYATVGAVVVRRVPGNPVGWAAWGFGMTAIVGVLLKEYAGRALTVSTALPLGHLASWIGFGLSPVAFMFFLPLFLLRFPTGRPVSARWRLVEALVVADVAAIIVAWVAAWPARGLALVLAREEVTGAPLTNAISGVALPAGIALSLTALASAVVRFRRAAGIERLQLKWFFAGAVTVIVTILVTELSPTTRLQPAMEWIDIASFCLIPVTAGIAMVRYRLYDIDRLVSRTVAWAVVTALVVGIYLAVVVAAQSVLRPFTGSTDLGIALATLAAAAGVRPLESRVRRLVDRRFDRARYDAARTVDAFGRSLRDEVSRDVVVDALRATANRTVAPSSVGVLLIRGGAS